MRLKNLIYTLLLLLPFIILESCNSPKELDGLKDGIYAKITIANKGSILLFLEHQKTPLTVANFVGLAEGKIANNFKAEGEPFFNGMVFHRVVPNFMIQGGDPQANGMGGPGYSFKDEFDPSLKHSRPGILSMANSGPATNGSQFFITHVPTPHLNGRHSVFGNVVTGQDVVNAVVGGDVIESIEILRKGGDAKAFDAAETFSKAEAAGQVVRR